MKHVILFLAANPHGTSQLSLDAEARAIHAELKRSGCRDRFEFVTRWAVEPLDLLRELRELKPTVVHFSGYGRKGKARSAKKGALKSRAVVAADPDQTGLCFHSGTGEDRVVTADTIAQTFGALSTRVQLVVLNACYSSSIAKVLLAHVDCVVGMSGAIQAAAARSFAIGFYGGLGEEASAAAAFQQGRAAINLSGLPNANHPQLRVRAGFDAKQMVLAAVTKPIRSDRKRALQARANVEKLTIIAERARAHEGFTVIAFTIKNNAEHSQVLTRLEVNVLDIFFPPPGGGASTTRVLTSISEWDFALPLEKGMASLASPAPVLIGADDAVTIDIRFYVQVNRDETPMAPHKTYQLSLAFISDSGLRAISSCMMLHPIFEGHGH